MCVANTIFLSYSEPGVILLSKCDLRIPRSTYSFPAIVGPFVTVTSQVATNPPEIVFAVIVAEPSAMAVTTPSADTVATASSLEDQTTLGYAPTGAMVAINVSVEPEFRLIDILFKVTPVAGTYSLSSSPRSDVTVPDTLIIASSSCSLRSICDTMP